MLYQSVTLLCGMANGKINGLKSWSDTIEPYRNPSKTDRRTDIEIERDIIKEYNKIYRIE